MTHHDWSHITADRIETLLAHADGRGAVGYLVWAKIDHSCLRRDDLDSLLAADLSTVRGIDPALRLVHEAKASLIATMDTLAARGVTHITTGVSWCDWVEFPGGRAWIRWYLREFAERFRVMPRIAFTPPSLTGGGTINARPKPPAAFAAFVHEFLSELGECCETQIELWNEWNLDTDWRHDLDPGYRYFAGMIASGALVAHAYGKRAALGGMAGITSENIEEFAGLVRMGLFRYVDASSFHDLRGTWGDQVPSEQIPAQLSYVRGTFNTPVLEADVLERTLDTIVDAASEPLRQILIRERARPRRSGTPPVWITEYGFPVVDPEGRFPLARLERIQVALFAYTAYSVLAGDVERMYWYTHKDYVGVSVRAHTTGWEDVLQYYYGDTDLDGKPRLLGRLLDEGGAPCVLRYAAVHDLFPLVDAASLGRRLPKAYKSNRASGR